MTGGLADLAERGLAARRIAAMEQHRRPPGGQLPRDGLAEPIGRAGDENDLVGNWPHWFTPRVHPCPFGLYRLPIAKARRGWVLASGPGEDALQPIRRAAKEEGVHGNREQRGGEDSLLDRRTDQSFPEA